MGVINKKERFATEGIRFQRHNGDGTIPTPHRFLGFANTVDLTKVLTNGKGSITLKVDANQAETKTVDFSKAKNLTAVTVNEAVKALNDAEFAGAEFSVDEKTGRLRGRIISIEIIPELPEDFEAVVTQVTNGANPVVGGSKIQFVSALAGALDFGQSRRHGGYGLEIMSFFDDETISIGLPKDIKDKEEIDIEGAKGTITRMIIGAMLQGLSPVVTLKQKDYYLLEMIQGGSLDRVSGTYDPPLSKESEHPSFYAEIFSAIYSEGSNKLSDVAGYERILLRSMMGMEGDVPIEAKAWAQYAFNLTATEYVDESGESFTAYQEATLTLEQFDSLRVKEIRI
jgi:hypothetical protein